MSAYDVFSAVYGGVVGSAANEFRFQEGVTFLSSSTVVVGIVYLYFAFVFLLQLWMRNRRPFSLSKFLIFHNSLLCVASLLLLVLLVENIALKIYTHGLKFALCDPDMFADGRLELLYFMNYLIKYWEFVDTVLLVLRKKPLEFLHVYHHALTMLLCYTQLNGNTTVQWIPITLNLAVHVLMYYYYARSAAGAMIWWKKYLTTLQITQFLLDLAAIYFCHATWYAHQGVLPQFLNFGSCHGTEFGGHFGMLVLTSYLYLFIEFFINTYSTKKHSKVYSQKELQEEVNIKLSMVQSIHNFGRRMQPVLSALFGVEALAIVAVGILQFWPSESEPLEGNKADAFFLYVTVHGLFILASLLFKTIVLTKVTFLKWIFVIMLVVDTHIIGYQHFVIIARGYMSPGLGHDLTINPLSGTLLVALIAHTVFLCMFAYKMIGQSIPLLQEEGKAKEKKSN